MVFLGNNLGNILGARSVGSQGSGREGGGGDRGGGWTERKVMTNGVERLGGRDGRASEGWRVAVRCVNGRVMLGGLRE